MSFIHYVTPTLREFLKNLGFVGCYVVLVGYDVKHNECRVHVIWPSTSGSPSAEAVDYLEQLLLAHSDEAVEILEDSNHRTFRLAQSTEAVRRAFATRYADTFADVIRTTTHSLAGSSLEKHLLRNVSTLHLDGYIKDTSFAPQHCRAALAALQKELLVSLSKDKSITEEYVASHSATLHRILILGAVRGFLAHSDARSQAARTATAELSTFLTVKLLEYLEKALEETHLGTPTPRSIAPIIKELFPPDEMRKQRDYSLRLPSKEIYSGKTFVRTARMFGNYLADVERVILGWDQLRNANTINRHLEIVHVATHHLGTIFKIAPPEVLSKSNVPEAQQYAIHLRNAAAVVAMINCTRKFSEHPRLLAQDILARFPSEDVIVTALESIVSYYTCRTHGRWKWMINGADQSVPTVEPYLPLFRENTEDMSLMLTMGLSEMLVNISKYPTRHDGETAMRMFSHMPVKSRVVHVRIDPSMVMVTYPICSHNVPASQTIKRIRALEDELAATVFGGLYPVRTAELERVPEAESDGRLRRVRQVWRIDIDVLRRFREEICEK